MKEEFLFGYGLFETMRAYNRTIVYFDQHLRRILNSSKLIGLKAPYPKAKLKEKINAAVKRGNFQDAYIRLTFYKREKGTDILITVKKYQPYPAQKYQRGFYASISSLRQNEGSLLARLKTTNRLLYQLSLKVAKDKGFDEAIILNQRGYIAEGSRSNLFFAKSKEIFTSALACGCLDGITRQVIFDLAGKYKIKINEGNFTLEDLKQADEAFFTNSLIGVMPLARIEKESIGKGRCVELTKFFTARYNSLLK